MSKKWLKLKRLPNLRLLWYFAFFYSPVCEWCYLDLITTTPCGTVQYFQCWGQGSGSDRNHFCFFMEGSGSGYARPKNWQFRIRNPVFETNWSFFSWKNLLFVMAISQQDPDPHRIHCGSGTLRSVTFWKFILFIGARAVGWQEWLQDGLFEGAHPFNKCELSLIILWIIFHLNIIF